MAGEWWPEDYAGPPLISLGNHIVQGLGVTVGDSLTINILGRDIIGRVASLRVIDWSTLGNNFVIVFAPGALEAAPQSPIATVHVAPADEGALFRAVPERLPNVSGVGASNVLESIKRLLGDISTGARAAGLVTMRVSALVGGGAVAAGQRRHIYHAVVLKVPRLDARPSHGRFRGRMRCIGSFVRSRRCCFGQLRRLIDHYPIDACRLGFRTGPCGRRRRPVSHGVPGAGLRRDLAGVGTRRSPGFAP